ncbi:DUF5011 domain-containing protein [Cocleimonas sp. KMM 6892]|uniref:immunoglobulin-like domain-containing protein n=1 Tax=unclassified Cocleimonas TaxID=2639732 RepID=UPI002DB5E1ED|nr:MULTISPECIES: immunoglobulin-like domain-containing protein [unclassified Cocleimonas]MEB8431224.1 DUF5011 domain-containing protein [Cocleimonas sp. KMM 6892]MEC4714004.1 DUF5011 domain-containing protein [Cocleimonas sp. KMM 6895]MEC4743335.1 DUF5011 domain-containing protein [Cocleimonas sp. KMM 6896]
MHFNKLNVLQASLSILITIALSACGGGGSSSSADSDPSGGYSEKESAIEKIKAYSNGESNTAPTINDYVAAGVLGVTNETLSELNNVVKELSPEEVDSTSELEALTTQLGVNISPEVSAGGNQTVEVNKSIEITGTATDSDGKIVSYSWQKDDQVLATTATFVYTPTTVGTDSLILTVTDNDGATASDSISLVVTAVQTVPNKAPTANAGSNKTVEVGQSIEMVGSGTDSDGSISAYEWSIDGTVLSSVSTFLYTPSEIGTDTLTLSVLDNDGSEATDTVKIVVTEATFTPNKAPTANAGADKVTQVNKGILIAGSGADSDGTISSYEWSKGPTILATSASFTYTPTDTGTDTLTLKVTDNDGDSSVDEMDVQVIAAPTSDTTPPVISLLGENPVSVDQGASYNDAGATASDNADGSITANIIVAGDTVNTNSAAGTSFTITYNVTDAAGNAASQVTRTVNVVSAVDTTDPVITLSGPSTVEVIQGANYVESGATANDDRDGNITTKILIAGDTVNTSASPGTTFTITYNVSDAAGNSAIEVTRSVSIIESSDNQIPVLSASTQQNYLAVINEARAQARSCGEYGSFPAAPAVSWSDKLYKAAYEHSQDLTETNTFSHDGSGTVSDWSGYPLSKQSTMTDRVATYGYSWSRLSENVSAGTGRDTPEEAVQSWLDSDGHCKNVMDANVTQVGMALSSKSGTTYTHYWTQNFGRP